MIIKWVELWSSSLKFALSRVINFLISHNNTNSQSGSNVISEERKSSVKRIFIDWTTYSQRYFHNTCVTDSKESWFKYLRSKRTYPFKGAHGVVFPKTILQHLLSPCTKFLEYDYNNAWLKHWSLPINFVAWYVLTVVHPDIITV